jgi:hypothetical protein
MSRDRPRWGWFSRVVTGSPNRPLIVSPASRSYTVRCTETRKGLATKAANSLICLVAGARNDLQANRSLAFRFAVVT